jgi:iron complex outermembrane receptor protein
MKATFFNNSVSHAAVYEINQRNILMNANDPKSLVTRGSERSRGFECDLWIYHTRLAN